MSTPVVTIFVRHSEGCKYAGDEFSRRCKCRKHFRWSQNGVQHRQKAGTHSWETAEELKRQLQDKLAGRAPEAQEQPQLIEDGITLFVQDKRTQGISAGVVSRYKNELARFQAYCADADVLYVQGITRELLTGYAATWADTYPSSNTRASVRERLRGFLRYCYDCQWLERVPSVPKVAVDEAPTLPLTPEEYERVLAAVELVRPLRFDAKGVTRLLSPATKARLRALVQLMRWSGLAIQDAVKLKRSSITHNHGLYRVVTARQKTGTDVSVPIPADVAKEILAAPSPNPNYIFWNGNSKSRGQVTMWGSRYMRPLFEAAGVRSGHMVSHRLRDTFAVDLLSKGVPMEEVSKLLGHESIRTTEKSYSKWVQDRQDRLDALVTGTWTASAKKRKGR